MTTINDLEFDKFVIDANWDVAVRVMDVNKDYYYYYNLIKNKWTITRASTGEIESIEYTDDKWLKYKITYNRTSWKLTSIILSWDWVLSHIKTRTLNYDWDWKYKSSTYS
jgi:hypothetical protein